MNKELISDMVSVAIFASIISTGFIQKLKQTFGFSNYINKLLSLFFSFILGFLFSLSFYSSYIIYDLWIGLFTSVGAETLYKTFKGTLGLQSSQKKE